MYHEKVHRRIVTWGAVFIFRRNVVFFYYLSVCPETISADRRGFRTDTI